MKFFKLEQVMGIPNQDPAIFNSAELPNVPTEHIEAMQQYRLKGVQRRGNLVYAGEIVKVGQVEVVHSPSHFNTHLLLAFREGELYIGHIHNSVASVHTPKHPDSDIHYLLGFEDAVLFLNQSESPFGMAKQIELFNTYLKNNGVTENLRHIPFKSPDSYCSKGLHFTVSLDALCAWIPNTTTCIGVFPMDQLRGLFNS